MDLVVGTAGWSIALSEADRFGAGENSLARYATRFAGVEINSSFHRPHRKTTWERWAASVPADFRFSVKVPKAITHQAKLADCSERLGQFLDEAAGLGDKLAIVLVQLPPSQAFDPKLAESFFDMLRERMQAQGIEAGVVCEPRHASWFEDEADGLMERLRIARVAADPARTPSAALPGGWRGMSYFRLHGSPVPYRSSYDDGRLDSYAELIAADLAAGRRAWCIFDNTASSAATGNAFALMEKLAETTPQGLYITASHP